MQHNTTQHYTAQYSTTQHVDLFSTPTHSIMFFLLNSIAILLCSLCQGAALKIYNVFFFFASFLFCVYVLLLLLLLLLLLMLTVCTQLTDICVINSAFCALLKKKKYSGVCLSCWFSSVPVCCVHPANIVGEWVPWAEPRVYGGVVAGDAE